MAKEVIVSANRVHNWKKLGKIIKLSLLILLLLLIIVFLVLKILYHDGSFVVTLESNENLKSGLIMYETLYDPTPKRILVAENYQFMDNISIKWLPNDLDKYEGQHNGDNYIAYSFYIENHGDRIINYWYKIIVDDVVKDVDEAIRVMLIVNDEKVVYAKGSSINNEPEANTKKFRSDEDGTIILEPRYNSNPGDIDKITVVVWIEGDDPECIDALIGGEMRMHMLITEEHQNKD